MPDTKFLSNQRVTIALALTGANPFANPAAPTVTEMNAIKNVSAATRMNGYSFNMKASATTTDRSFADSASTVARGFLDFGGAIPFYLPTNFADTSDILQQVFTLYKTQGVGLWVAVRLAPLNSGAFVAGDWLSVYQVLTDAGEFDTAGNIGSIANVTFLPQGNVYPNAIVAPATPSALVMTIPTAGSIGKVIWPVVTYQGINVTQDCTYTSSDTTKIAPNGDGAALYCVAAGTTTTVTASFPGATSVVSAAITTT
jgi:hypothetical protein